MIKNLVVLFSKTENVMFIDSPWMFSDCVFWKIVGKINLVILFKKLLVI